MQEQILLRCQEVNYKFSTHIVLWMNKKIQTICKMGLSLRSKNELHNALYTANQYIFGGTKYDKIKFKIYNNNYLTTGINEYTISDIFADIESYYATDKEFNMELNKKFKEKQMSENFILGIMLALCGGFLDAYTYITRGGVFANAQTGNIVLMGINIAKGDFERVIHYVVPILAFALGILISEVIKATLKKNTHMHWRQIIVLAEIIILIICGFIPSVKGNTFVNVMVSFVCSLQVESFRVINGNTVATTMCTGNLRRGTELLFLGISKKDKSIAIRSLTYYGINLFFVIGAIVGAVVTKYLDVKSVFIASALLIIPFIMMFKSSENVEYI